MANSDHDADGVGAAGGQRADRLLAGRYFEDFALGERYRHPLGRTVTETDNIWMTLLSQNTAPDPLLLPLRR